MIKFKDVADQIAKFRKEALDKKNIRAHDSYDQFYQILFTYRSAVARTDNKDILYVGITRHRDVYHHLVIDILVLFGEHYISVKGEYPPELVCVEDCYILIVALARI